MVSRTISALVYGAGLVSALPHAGHHGHCGSKCSTSSAASATISTGVVASNGFPAPTSITNATSAGLSTGIAPSSVFSSMAMSSAIANTTAVATTAAVASSAPVKATADAGCTFTDSAKAASGVKSCKNVVLSGIAVPAGETLDLSDAADGTTFTFEGTTTFGYKEWDGPLIRFAGTDITIQGADGHLIDGNGAQWWDGKGTNGGKTKPKFFYAHDLTDSTITGLSIKNTPVQGFSINSSKNLKVVDITIDNSAGDGEDGGHNTDAFDVGSSTGVYISGANIKNQDDCLAINSGTDISFTGGTCSGGHGISIGSVGGRDDNDVEGVYIADSTVTNSDNGIRIKTVSGATGSVKNVTYSNIKLSSINKYGVVIEQDYENGSPTGTPTAGVPITDVTVNGITGTVGSKAEEVYILCASCSDWKWSGVSITGGEKSGKCEGIPSGASC